MSESGLPVESWDETKDGPLSSENMKKKLESQGYQCTEYEFAPGTVFPDHSHEITKKDAIISGQFRFSMNNKTVVMKPGDMLEVPKGMIHNAAVVGDESVIFFDSTRKK